MARKRPGRRRNGRKQAPSSKKRNGIRLRRLPRRVPIGKGYVLYVVLVSQKIMHEVLETEDEYAKGEIVRGAWVDNFEAEPMIPAGYIYIYQALSMTEKWEVYWHELIHAIHDVAEWDRQPSSK